MTLTFVLSYLDATNLVADPGPWWYLGTVLMDLFTIGAVAKASA